MAAASPPLSRAAASFSSPPRRTPPTTAATPKSPPQTTIRSPKMANHGSPATPPSPFNPLSRSASLSRLCLSPSANNHCRQPLPGTGSPSLPFTSSSSPLPLPTATTTTPAMAPFSLSPKNPPNSRAKPPISHHQAASHGAPLPSPLLVAMAAANPHGSPVAPPTTIRTRNSGQES